jgi:hypothetical protein
MNAEDLWDKEVELDLPDEIIAHVTRECGGNVHGRAVVEVISSSVDCNDRRFAGRGSLIWKKGHILVRIFTGVRVVLCTQEIIGCDTISRRDGLRPATTPFVRILVIVAGGT